MDNKKFENIKLILKNAKINLILVSNNLSLFNSINKEYGSTNVNLGAKINKVINKVECLDSGINSDIDWIDKTLIEYDNVERENENIINDLSIRVDKLVILSNKNMNDNKDSNVLMGSKKKSKVDEDVGSLFGIVLGYALGVTVNTIANKYYKPAYDTTGASYATSYTSQTGNNSNNNPYAKFFKNITKIVNSFTSKVKKWVSCTKKGIEFKDGYAVDKKTGKVISICFEGELPDGIEVKDGVLVDVTGAPVYQKEDGNWYYVESNYENVYGKWKKDGEYYIVCENTNETIPEKDLVKISGNYYRDKDGKIYVRYQYGDDEFDVQYKGYNPQGDTRYGKKNVATTIMYLGAVYAKGLANPIVDMADAVHKGIQIIAGVPEDQRISVRKEWDNLWENNTFGQAVKKNTYYADQLGWIAETLGEVRSTLAFAKWCAVVTKTPLAATYLKGAIPTIKSTNKAVSDCQELWNQHITTNPDATVNDYVKTIGLMGVDVLYYATKGTVTDKLTTGWSKAYGDSRVWDATMGTVNTEVKSAEESYFRYAIGLDDELYMGDKFGESALTEAYKSSVGGS